MLYLGLKYTHIIAAIFLFGFGMGSYLYLIAASRTANPQVIADTVASPLEQAINGVEGMMYMQSQMSTDGKMVLTVSFEQHINADIAQIQVQNRVSRALPRLPPEVQRIGGSHWSEKSPVEILRRICPKC